MQTAIKLNLVTRERLKQLGHKGETYDDVLQRLMDRYERTDETKDEV